MEEIAQVSKHFTKRFMLLLVKGQYWGIPLEFKLAPGVTAEDIDHSVRDFEVTASRLVMPPEAAFNSVQVFNFDDTQWSSGPLPRGVSSHNTIIYVSDFGARWVQDFFLWSAAGRSKHMVKLVFRVAGEDVVASYDGIWHH